MILLANLISGEAWRSRCYCIIFTENVKIKAWKHLVGYKGHRGDNVHAKGSVENFQTLPYTFQPANT